MRVVTVGAEIVSSLPRAHKVSRSFPMNTRSPISVLRPMTFTTESIAFGEVYHLPIEQSQFIPIFCIVTVKTPSHRFSMVKFDIHMLLFQDSLFSIHFHGSMAVATGEHSLCQRRWRNRKLLLSPHHNGDKGNSKQKDEGEHKTCFSHICLNGVAGRKGGTNDLIPNDPFAKPAGTPMRPADCDKNSINFFNIFNNKKQNNFWGV